MRSVNKPTHPFLSPSCPSPALLLSTDTRDYEGISSVLFYWARARRAEERKPVGDSCTVTPLVLSKELALRDLLDNSEGEGDPGFPLKCLVELHPAGGVIHH